MLGTLNTAVVGRCKGAVEWCQRREGHPADKEGQAASMTTPAVCMPGAPPTAPTTCRLEGLPPRGAWRRPTLGRGAKPCDGPL